MRRDMDLIRDLLLKIEGGQQSFQALSDEDAEFLGTKVEVPMSAEEAAKLAYHLELMEKTGFIEIEQRGGAGAFLIGGITWAGYEFLDAVREPDTWRETKARAGKVGGWTIDLLSGLAKGYAKAKVAEYGFPIG